MPGASDPTPAPSNREQLNLALAVSAVLTRGGDLQEKLRACTDELVRWLHAAFARIWTLAPDENVLVLQASSGLYTHTDGAHARVPVGELMIGRIASDARPYLSREAAEDTFVDREWATREGIRSFAGYPLVVDGRVVGVLALFSRLPFDDELLDTLGAVSAVIGQAIERKRAETELTQTLLGHRDTEKRLAAIVEASSAVMDPPDLNATLDRILGLARKVFEADAYAVWRETDDANWGIVVSTGLSQEFTQVVLPYDTVQELTDPVVIEDVEVYTAMAHRLALYRHEGIRSFVAFPMRIRGRAVATVTFYFRQSHKLTPNDLKIGSAIANLASAAVEASETYQVQQELRQEAERHARRMTFLAGVSNLLVSAFDYEQTLGAVARLAIPTFADWCAVHLVATDGSIRHVATAHADPAKLEIARKYREKFPTRPDEDMGVAQVIRSNEPICIEEMRSELFERKGVDPGRLRVIEEMGLQSVIIVPMAARDRVLGALVFVTAESARRYGPDDLEVAKQVAHRAALAVDNARLFADTERQRIETEHAMQALASSHEQLKQFAYAASHDLREPLRTIGVFVELIERRNQGRLDKQAEEHMEYVIKGVRRMQDLLDDLLDFVRIGGTSQQVREPVPLRDAARDAVASLEAQIAEAHAVIEIGDLPVVRGDRLKLTQVFQNLISNSLKYRGEKQPYVRISADLVDAEWIISVSDNGIGIQPKHFDTIFGIFKRLHGQEYKGTGIGLALVKAIIESHRGRIWVESKAGEGATFRFALPADPGRL